MSTFEDVRKAIQDLIAPELRTITARLDGISERFKALDEKLDLRFAAVNQRFDSLEEKIAVDKKIEALQRRMDEIEPQKAGTN
jgi:tetrahydromethanopterin S-methyltransferase subunit G